MPELPSAYAGGSLVSSSTFSGSDSTGSATLTANVTAHTKGTAVELIAATTHDANWIHITISNISAALSGAMVDIMIGAATEQVIIPDLFITSRAAGSDVPSFLFPVFIPKGSRVSARWSAFAGSTTCSCSVRLIGGTMLSGGSGPSMVSGYGATTNSVGTNIDPGATINTWSAWTELTASTERDHRWLVISARYGDAAITASVLWRIQVGIGAATEQVLIPDIPVSADITSDMSYNTYQAFPIYIPKGSRLTVRARSNITTDADRDVYIRLYGAG